MFDVGYAEVFFLILVGVIVLGPERLPGVAKTLAGFMRRARQMAQEFQHELEKEVDLQEIKKIQSEFKEAAQPLKDAAKSIDEGNSILDQSVKSLASTAAIAGGSSASDVVATQTENNAALSHTDLADDIEIADQAIKAPLEQVQSEPIADYDVAGEHLSDRDVAKNKTSNSSTAPSGGSNNLSTPSASPSASPSPSPSPGPSPGTTTVAENPDSDTPQS